MRVQGRRQGMTDIIDTATGVAISIPAGLVTGPDAETWGHNWSSDDERLNIDTLNFRGQRSLGDVYQSIRGIKGRRVTQDTFESGKFVLQGSDADGSIFYVQAEERAGEVRGVSIVYSASARSELAPVVSAIVRSFRAFPEAIQAPRPSPAPPAAASDQLNRLQRQVEELQAKIREQEAAGRGREPTASGTPIREEQVRGEERESPPSR